GGLGLEQRFELLIVPRDLGGVAPVADYALDRLRVFAEILIGGGQLEQAIDEVGLFDTVADASGEVVCRIGEHGQASVGTFHSGDELAPFVKVVIEADHALPPTSVP